MPTSKVILDTSIMIDLVKSGSRRKTIEELLAGFHTKSTTSIVQLEYKATILAVCIKIHAEMRRWRRFTYVRDVLLEKNTRQARLRAHIFNNWIAINAPSIGLPGGHSAITEEEDAKLAETARLKMESIIPYLYRRFSEVIDDISNDAIGCTRAQEPPKKLSVAFDTNLPVCTPENRQCRVENFILECVAPFAADNLNGKSEVPEQLVRACSVVSRVVADSGVRLSHSDCRRCGDLLVTVEGLHSNPSPTHLMSTNESEWKFLSSLLNLEFVEVDYREF